MGSGHTARSRLPEIKDQVVALLLVALHQQVVDMGLHRPQRKEQLVGDLLLALALQHQSEHLGLALGDPVAVAELLEMLVSRLPPTWPVPRVAPNS